MAEKIYVVETITSGAEGYPYDEILSMGVCEVDLEGGEYDLVYDKVIGMEPKHLGKDKLDYAESKGFETPLLYGGIPLGDAVREFRELVRGGEATSYDIRQEFSKYLTNQPWDVNFITTILPSIMAHQPVSLKCKRPEQEPDIIVKAYRRTFRDDPAQVGKRRGAAELAKMASEMAIGLCARGKYRSEPQPEYAERPEEGGGGGRYGGRDVHQRDEQDRNRQEYRAQQAPAHVLDQEHQYREDHQAQAEEDPSLLVAPVLVDEAQAEQAEERREYGESHGDGHALVAGVHLPPVLLPRLVRGAPGRLLFTGDLGVALGAGEGAVGNDRSASWATSWHVLSPSVASPLRFPPCRRDNASSSASHSSPSPSHTILTERPPPVVRADRSMGGRGGVAI